MICPITIDGWNSTLKTANTAIFVLCIFFPPGDMCVSASNIFSRTRLTVIVTTSAKEADLHPLIESVLPGRGNYARREFPYISYFVPTALFYPWPFSTFGRRGYRCCSRTFKIKSAIADECREAVFTATATTTMTAAALSVKLYANSLDGARWCPSFCNNPVVMLKRPWDSVTTPENYPSFPQSSISLHVL